MATSILTEKFNTYCTEDAEFSLKFVITSLSLIDKDKSTGFTDILVNITFDGNVIKIENIEEPGEDGTIQIGREIIFQITPEKFAEKLRTSPIMLNLSRGCIELGDIKIDLTSCFIDSIKCDEFSSQTVFLEEKFMNGETENAQMTLFLQVSRAQGEKVEQMKNLYNNYTKEKVKAVDMKKADAFGRTEDCDNISSCLTNSDISITCDSNLMNLCQMDKEFKDIGKDNYSNPLCRPSNQSLNCLSDIVESLKSNQFPDSQKIFCHGCGRFSVSGVTCENKIQFLNPQMSHQKKSLCPSLTQIPSRTSDMTVFSEEICQPSELTRICSECFEDLSVLPKNAKCPKCACNAQLPRKLVSFRSKSEQAKEEQLTRDLVRSAVQEIFEVEKEKLVKNWRRLKCKKVKAPMSKTCQKFATKECGKVVCNKNPRCTKVLKTQQKFRQLKGKKANYELRNKHPGIVRGHAICRYNHDLVPKDMGWLWNVEIPGISKVRRGWRPGAVMNSVAKIMKLHLNPQLPLQEPKSIKKVTPTLRVKKENGEYVIIMNPLHDAKSGKALTLRPIIFKVTKSHDAKNRSKARELLKKRGVEKKCDCLKISECKCLNEFDKSLMECQLKKISKELKLEPVMDLQDLCDSSDNEFDCEFSPCFGMKTTSPYWKCRQANVSISETQYDFADIDKSGDCDKKLCDTKKKEKKNDDILIRKPVRKQQVVKVLRNQICNFCKETVDPCVDDDYRFTTNYNPVYAQCPPEGVCCF